VKPIYKIQFRFKASHYDFNMSEFYRDCGKYNHTIIIAKTTKGKILGGYTPLSYIIPNDKSIDILEFKEIKDESNSSFLFSLS